MSLGERGAYWNTDRLQNAASQSPSMLRFPRWMACQWRVEMGLCARGRTELRRARQWVESWCQLSESAFRVHHLPRLWKLLNFPPFHLFPSSPLLPFFRLFFFFFPALFSILLPISLIVVMPLFFFFFFLHNFEECIAVAHITVVLSNREWKRGSFSGNFIFRNAGLHWGCLNSRWFISVFDGSRASLGENKSYSWVLMKTKYQQSRGAAGQWSTTEPLPFLPFSHIPLWWHEGTFRDTVKKEICWMFFLHFLDKEHCGHANNDNEPCFHSCGSGVVF